MASNALVSTRIDKKVKADAAAVLEAMGLTVSDAVRMLLTRVAREGALPFEPLVPNAETIAAMKEARAGKLTEFNTIDDLMTDLNADD
jgi:DNA-damage-inducible protein J